MEANSLKQLSWEPKNDSKVMNVQHEIDLKTSVSLFSAQSPNTHNFPSLLMIIISCTEKQKQGVANSCHDVIIAIR